AHVPRGRLVRSLRARERTGRRFPLRVLHVIHPVPTGNQPGPAPGALGVSEPHLRAHRNGRREHVDVRWLDGPRRSGPDGSPNPWRSDLLGPARVATQSSRGTQMNFGGPLLGIFACRQQHIRKMPGRVIGLTRDAKGRRAFCMTLQTREQHIRREKAMSNICTNESLLAVAAAAYMAVLGS